MGAINLDNTGTGSSVTITSNGTGLFVGNRSLLDDTNTVTVSNKRILNRREAFTTSTTYTPSDTIDQHTITSLASDLTIANPSGSYTDGEKKIIRIKDDGIQVRALSWGTSYRGVGVTLPTSTSIGKWHYFGLVYNTHSATWDVIAMSIQE